MARRFNTYFDVGFSNLVAGIRHRDHRRWPWLATYEGLRWFGICTTWLNTTQSAWGILVQKKTQQIGGDAVAVDAHLCIGFHHRREIYLINVHQRIERTTRSPMRKYSSDALKLVIEKAPWRNWKAIKRWQYSFTSALVNFLCLILFSESISSTFETLEWKSSQVFGHIAQIGCARLPA